MRISLLVITARYGGMDILRANICRQTRKPDQVVLVDAHYEERKEAARLYFNGVLTHIPDPPKERLSNINCALNEGLARCTGDLIVLLQDYVWIPRHGIDRFAKAQKEKGPCLVTGVGNVGAEPNEVVDGSGLISIFGEDYGAMPSGVSWADPRITFQRGLVPCESVGWEANWACVPREAVEAIGGFDESYGDGWAWENVDFAARARVVGYPLFIDMDNRCCAFPHDRYFGHALKADKDASNAVRCANDLEALMLGHRSARVPYLEERR